MWECPLSEREVPETQVRPPILAGSGAVLARRTFDAGGLAGLAGCGAIPTPPPKPTIIGVRLLADDTINPSLVGVASPVTVRLYVLKDDTNFMQSDFQTLWSQDAQILGPSMVSKKEIVVPPNGNIPVKEEAPPDATLVGAIAAFRTIDQAQWRTTIGLKPSLVNDVQLNLVGLTAQFIPVVVGWKGDPTPPLFPF